MTVNRDEQIAIGMWRTVGALLTLLVVGIVIPAVVVLIGLILTVIFGWQ